MSVKPNNTSTTDHNMRRRAEDLRQAWKRQRVDRLLLQAGYSLEKREYEGLTVSVTFIVPTPPERTARTGRRDRLGA